jgi:adenylosuccinate lyase
MSTKLPISRFQRDLSDSTVLRNIGSAFGYTTLALNSLEKGLNKLEINKEAITHELNNHYELLSEPLQTVMRYYGFENPYEQMKGLTRGKSFTKEDYLNFVETLNLPEKVKNDLKQLSPENYLGNAEEMAKNIKNYLKL